MLTWQKSLLGYNAAMSRWISLAIMLCGAVLAQQPTVPTTTPAPERVEGKPVVTFSGVQVFEIKVGTGKKAIPGFTLRMHYTGWYKKNKTTYVIFDTSRHKEPLEFDLGMRRVIKGWDEGIPGMRVGGKRQLIVPPEAAYGNRGFGSIPPNTTLIFEVELVEVR